MTTLGCTHCGCVLELVESTTPTPRSKNTSQPSTSGAGNWLEVDKLATCNRCRERSLAWQKSKSGKFYLCRGRQGEDGKFYANRKEFHACPGTMEPKADGALAATMITDDDIPF